MPTFNPFDPFASGADATFDPFAWAQSSTESDFAAWERELATLVEQHFTPTARTGAEGGLSGKPAHDPSSERIVSAEVRRSRAEVKTVFPDGNFENHFTYRLVDSDEGWRIDKIVHTHVAAETHLIADDEVGRMLMAVESEPSWPAVPDELAEGMTALFSGRFEVLEVGEVTTSGVLTAHDLGWLRFDVSPFRRRIRRWSYSVELAREGGTNVAVRLRVSDQKTVARVPAMRVDSDNVIVVDAANVAILDFMALAACDAARAGELTEDNVREVGTTGTVFSVIGEAPEAATVQSGYGDGAYPAFWGLDSDGAVTDLLVDFLVAVEDITSTLTIPWVVGPTTQPDLVPHEFEIVAVGDSVVFRYRQQAESSLVRNLRVLDSHGSPLPGREGGVFVQGGISERRWQFEGPIPVDAALEVTLVQGYRHV